MRRIERTTICVVLMIAPFVGIGCTLRGGGPPQLTRKEPKIFAVQREKPLSAQVDTNKKSLQSAPLEKATEPAMASEIATDERTSNSLNKTDEKPRFAKIVSKPKKAESEPLAETVLSEEKELSKKDMVPSTDAKVLAPPSVNLAKESTVTSAQFSEKEESTPLSSQIELAGHEESEEIEFEIPNPVSSPVIYPDVPQRAWDAPDEDEIKESLESSTSRNADEWNSADGFDVNINKIEERDFQQVCLVKFREERVFAPGLSEYTVEHHAQRYQFSSAEAAEKFQAAPEQYVPTAGGLDLVAFGNNQEVVHGSLEFAVWYNKRLFLFSSRENIATFQTQPEKFAAIK